MVFVRTIVFVRECNAAGLLHLINTIRTFRYVRHSNGNEWKWRV